MRLNTPQKSGATLYAPNLREFAAMTRNGTVSGALRAASGISGPAMGIQANERSRENGVLMGGVFGLGLSATFSAEPGLYRRGQNVLTASKDELSRTARQE
ncbi:hypothetical protein ACOBR2_07140 [Telmatobacter bradus]|uniref:hypothetical protein n=1 Tax=Telmatobacter bradus TaxID=474953 RepID=UPI003B42FD2A